MVSARSIFLLVISGLMVLGFPAPRADAEEVAAQASVLASWDCTGSPCPWGERTTSEAATWPAAAEPIRTRHGYTVSHDVYAKAPAVAGWTIRLATGSATVYAGTPTGSHRALTSLDAGQTYTIPTTLAADEVVSVQNGSAFSHTLTPGPTTPTTTPTATPTPTTTPTTTPTSQPTGSACTDPTRCNPVSWVDSRWRYTGAGTNPGDWYGGVITWPSWSAYSSNNRQGDNSRAVYSASGEKLYPYMGEWADGCKVTVVSGAVLIIEWERGTDSWRETTVATGDTHTINLTGSENGAMIETPNNSEPFTVSLSSCTPQPIDKGSSD
jgi:hypothetical protein